MFTPWSPPSVNLFHLHSQVLLLSMMIIGSSAYAVKPGDMATFLSTHEIEFEEVQQYFDAQLGLEGSRAGDDIPRLFPVCIKSDSKTLTSSTELKELANVLGSMEMAYDCRARALPFYAFDKKAHLVSSNSDPKSEWIRKITLGRLLGPEPDMKNMRQWMRIFVETSDDVKYLYLQSIVGPLGLPSGEFTNEALDCTEQGKIENPGLIIPCDYRSKADINHPVAYFATKRSTTSKGFQLNYKWHDITCLESPYLQFILIAIKDPQPGAIMGKHFEAFLSPIYTNFEFDSHDGTAQPIFKVYIFGGLISPYYVEFAGQLDCKGKTTARYHDGDQAPLKWKDSFESQSQLHRLPFNEDFEKCLRTKAGADEVRRECPPGPLECSPELSFKTTGLEAVVTKRKEYFDMVVKKISCLPCYLPSQEEVDGCPVGKDSFRVIVSTGRKRKVPEYLDYNEVFNAPIDAREHGAIQMLIFLVILPIANFVGRFYRETVLVSCCRSGKAQVDLWIVIHGILHLLGWLLMWISFGSVTTGQEGLAQMAEYCFADAANHPLSLNSTAEAEVLEKLDDCIMENTDSSMHIYVSLGTVLLYQFQLIYGICRSHKPSIRNLQVTIHSHFGYAVYILGVVAIYFSSEGKACGDLQIWTVLSLALTLTAFVIATWLSIKEDTQIGVQPRRYQWPILEHIQLLGRSPVQLGKLILLGCYVGLLIAVWVGACISLSTISFSEAMVFGDVSRDDGSSISGLFSQCRNASLAFTWKRMSKK